LLDKYKNRTYRIPLQVVASLPYTTSVLFYFYIFNNMRTKAQQITDAFYQAELRKAICSKVKNQIVEFNACRNLSTKLTEFGTPISAHTLARFFGVIHSDNRPYAATLDILCRFIGSESYAQFCMAIGETIEYALFFPKDAFAAGSYSLTAFELAIAENDWKTMNDLLESVDLDHPFTYELVMYLGNAVRNHPNKKDFLHALSQSKNGRWFFYESFVDEDDENNYYSDALLEYYAKSPILLGNQIFIQCFLAVKFIYANKSVDKSKFNWIHMDGMTYDQFHFHEISRILELKILLDYQDKTLNRTYATHLDLVCELSEKMNHFNASWVLARTIKALSFSGIFKLALEHEPFKNSVLKRFQENPSRLHSIGELIIQFVGHSYFLQYKKEKFMLPPIRLSYRHDNETKSRIAIESATAIIYAEDRVKSLLKKNLYSFTEKTHQTWINPLIFD